MEYNWTNQISLFMGNYTVAERRVAQYLLENQGQVQSMTLRMVAGAMNVGQPTVVRMLKKAGYENWKSFLQHTWTQERVNTTYEENKKIPAALQSIQADLHVINEMALHLDIRMLKQLAKDMKRAHIIDIYGTDNSASAASELSGKLLHMGLPSRNYLDLFYQKISAGHLGARDVAVGFSMSGETNAVVEAIEAAKDSKATTVAVTGNIHSSLSKKADYIIYTPTIVLNQSSRWISSRITQNVFVDVICSVILENDTGSISQNLEQSINEFKEDISGTVRSIAP